MPCWCGHGPWHRFGPCCGGYGYGPRYRAGYEDELGPPRVLRRRRSRAEDLEDYLRDLEAEVADVRAELDELRRSRPSA